jgi:hypothetical protein
LLLIVAPATLAQDVADMVCPAHVALAAIEAIGIIADDAAEGAEFPAALVATIVKVYDVPLVKPVTTKGEFAPVAVKPPGEDVTV